ncbi:hypothetical protein [Phenylobacterium sp.]|jgi:hypothetical protein|uniref:hypothetical protein n=1 Tax=Phenylobacterium sp. TaxID=1871053 RepID=UPI002F3F34AB
MGILGNFGFKSSKSKTSQTTTTDHTTTPIVPDWAAGPISEMYGKVQNIGRQDPSTFVADAHPLQQTAANNAGALGNPWNWDGAADLTRGSTMSGGPAAYGAESLLTGLDNYKNPYLSDVLNTSLRDYDIGADRTRGQQALDLAGSGAFGGSGAALTRSMTEGELSRGRGSLAAGLYSNAFNTATNLSNQDAQRRQDAGAANAAATNAYNAQAAAQRLAAGGQLANIAASYGADQRANTSLQSDIGTLFRGIAQEQLNAPLNLISWQNQQYGTLPTQLFVGQHQVGVDNTVGKSSENSFNLSGGFDLPISL